MTATYDKDNHRLHLAAIVPAELVSENEEPRPPKDEASGNSYIAGAGFGHLPATGYRFVEERELL